MGEENSSESTGMDRKYLEGEDTPEVRLGKRLTYLLRYGAEKQGLEVREGGFVQFTQLLEVPLLKHDTADDVMSCLVSSTSGRKTRRFEVKVENNIVYVRATYGRHMERRIEHEGCNIKRLLENCVDFICDHIVDYDLTNFPDEYLLHRILHRLQRAGKLNNKALRSILGPTIERLDFSGVYLTESSLSLVARSCPHLKMFNLHRSGYIITDHLLLMTLKKLKELKYLNISGCSHITDGLLKKLPKIAPNLTHLNIAHVSDLTEAAITDYMIQAPVISHIDIHCNDNISENGRETIREIALSRNLTVLHQELQIDGLTGSDPSGVLSIWKTNVS